MAFKAVLIPQNDAQELCIRIAGPSAKIDLHRRKNVWQIRTDLDKANPSHVTASDKIWTAVVNTFEATLLALVCSLDRMWPIETDTGNGNMLELLADTVTTALDAISNDFDE